jgi:hypothetical protein
VYGGAYGGAATAATGVTSGTGIGMGLGQTASATSFAFANGGIMSSLGSLPLKAYSNGGVASTPQLALFGEGKMNEAYVPLPDGRSIPVTFSGGGTGATAGSKDGASGGVTISIVINKSGTETTNTSGDDNSQAQELATKIKGIVREVLMTETRPNGILDKRK